jgi:hypothetical protein
MKRHVLKVAILLLPLVAGGLVTGCGGRLGRPPVEVLQRPSLVGAGVIVQLKSTTSEPLTEIEVTISGDGREITHREDVLAGYETVEIGWKKLGGWEIPEEAEVEIRVRGYLLPVHVRLTPADEGEQSG